MPTLVGDDRSAAHLRLSLRITLALIGATTAGIFWGAHLLGVPTKPSPGILAGAGLAGMFVALWRIDAYIRWILSTPDDGSTPEPRW